MEYVDGMDLQRVVEANGPLDCESAVDCIRQAADGLAHAHARNMIHCDIKPSNLIVNEQGIVKILDMGLARLVGHDKPDGCRFERGRKADLGLGRLSGARASPGVARFRPSGRYLRARAARCISC